MARWPHRTGYPRLSTLALLRALTVCLIYNQWNQAIALFLALFARLSSWSGFASAYGSPFFRLQAIVHS